MYLSIRLTSDGIENRSGFSKETKSVLNAAPILVFENVQTALFLGRPRPPSGSFIFPVEDCSRTGPTADAGIVLVVESVVRHVVFKKEVPDVAFGPLEEWVDLDQTELAVPLNNVCCGSVFCLVTTNRANPGPVAFHGSANEADFPILATFIRIDHVQRSVVPGLVFVDSRFWANVFDFDPVFLLDSLAELEGFGKLVARLEIKNANVWVDLCEHMNDAAAFRSERRSHRQVGMERLHRPAQNRLGAFVFQFLGGFRDFVESEFCYGHRFSFPFL